MMNLKKFHYQINFSERKYITGFSVITFAPYNISI